MYTKPLHTRIALLLTASISAVALNAVVAPDRAWAVVCGNASAGGAGSGQDTGQVETNTACGGVATPADARGDNSQNTAIGNASNALGDASTNTAIGTATNAAGTASSNTAVGTNSNAFGDSGAANTAAGAAATAGGNNGNNAAFGSTANANGLNGHNTAIGAGSGLDMVQAASIRPQAPARTPTA